MRIIGIELGAWSVKAVEGEARFRRFDLLDFHEVRLPIQISDPTQVYQQAVQQLLARLPTHPDKIVTSLPPSQTALRFLPFPIKQLKKVEKMYLFELEDAVPFKLNESIVEHHIDKTKDGCTVFAAVAPVKHVQSHLEWLRTLGIDPDWLTFEGMGLVNLYLSSQVQKQDSESEQADPVLIMDIGHSKTNVAIISEDRLTFIRSIPWGGLNISQSISHTLGVSIEEAEEIKLTELKLDVDMETMTGDSRDMVFAGVQAFSNFMAEISHSLAFYRSHHKESPVRTLITGGTSKLWGIERFLNQALDLPVEHVRPFEGLKIRQEMGQKDDSRFGEAVGRSLVFERNAPLLFNFRKHSLGKETSLTEVSEFLKDVNVIKLLKYAGALALLLFFHVNIADYLAQQDVKQANTEVSKLFDGVFTGVAPKARTSLLKNPNELKRYIDQKNNELERRLKMLSKAGTPMLSKLLTISDSFPQEVRVDVNSMVLDDQRLMIEGVLYEGDINKVTENLKRIKFLDNVNLEIKEEGTGKRFAFKADIKGGR